MQADFCEIHPAKDFCTRSVVGLNQERSGFCDSWISEIFSDSFVTIKN